LAVAYSIGQKSLLSGDTKEGIINHSLFQREHLMKNSYELTYIVNAVLSDEQIKKVVQRITELITENGGEIIEVDEWGTRRLAYTIQKKRNGYYVNMYIRAMGDLIMRLERALEIDDDILRYLTLRMDAKMLRYYEKQKDSAKRVRADKPVTFDAAEQPEVETDLEEEE